MKILNALLCFVLSCSFVFAAGPKAAEYTSVEDVQKDAALAADFAIQGEYLATIGDYGTFGIQIIAEGNSKFKLAVCSGGLPGSGWDGLVKEIRNVTVKDNKFIVEGQNDEVAQAIVGKDLITIKLTDGVTFTANKKVRTSPTLGEKAPEGAIVLFADGKPSDMFKKANVNEEAKTLWAEAETKPFEKRPYTLHIEFLLSYMPEARGQGRSNSGVYIDERYECQVLDSFGLEGKNNECGGFYMQAEPLVNMCFPPLQWQTYDIDFVPAKFENGIRTAAASITIKQNGVVIHKNFAPKSETPGRKKEGADPLGLYLQGHNNKVQYRNIWLKYND